MPRPRRSPKTETSSARGSLGDQAYQAIRDALRAGKIKAGDRMKERDLAARLGLGRTPVREALKRLAVQGLLGQYSGQGLVFRKLTQREIVEIHQVWGVLQGLAAQLAAQNATTVEIEAMRRLHARLAVEAARDVQAALRTARALDGLICAASHNAYLARSIEQLVDTVGFQTANTTFTLPGRAKAFVGEMDAIIAAIEARDGERAARAARDHNEKGLAARLALDVGAD